MAQSTPNQDTGPNSAPHHASERVFGEPADPLRSPFVLDRHRIIQSAAFRRLEGKTQVFAPSRGDHFRTRMTHTIEVSQLARVLAVGLGANENLAEAIALAHDLGHPPFGHAGEAALNRAMACMGGFNHNAHAVRVVEYLEHPFPAFRGLNLTLGTRAGLAAHATRYDRPIDRPVAPPNHHPAHPRSASPDRWVKDCHEPDQTTHAPPFAEASLVSLADRIAYNAHDLEDALGAELISLDDLAPVSLWSEAMAETGHQAVQNIHTIRRSVLDRIIDALISDAVANGSDSGEGGLALSRAAEAKLVALEEFLARKVYRAKLVVEADESASCMVTELFEKLIRDGSAMPQRFRQRITKQGIDRVVGDYIAGMTDGFCLTMHQEIVGGAGRSGSAPHLP